MRDELQAWQHKQCYLKRGKTVPKNAPPLHTIFGVSAMEFIMQKLIF